MTHLPIRPVIKPADLVGVTNGKLPAKLLRPIGPSGKLHHRAAPQWGELQALALVEGLILVHVGDYRSSGQQVRLFLERMKTYPDAKRKTQTTRKWDDQTWYLHVGLPVATPGTSNHGWGLAIDAALLVGKQVLHITTKPKGAKRSGIDFLLATGPGKGWSWELQVEPHHIRRVKPFEFEAVRWVA